MNRRELMAGLAGGAAALALRGVGASASDEAASTPAIAITMDDPKPDDTPAMPGTEINRRILASLRDAGIRAALFTTGMRIDNAAGAALLGEWDDAGHAICNHSYSHLNYNSHAVPYERFAADVLKNEPLIRGYRNFVRLFRYPALKEGDTAEKRDRMRALLAAHQYGVGHVTVDASDWYIDARMRAALQRDSGRDTRRDTRRDTQRDTQPYRDYYVAHIRDRARYYRQLAGEVLGREIPHTLLIHHNLLNALYLGDMMDALKHDGWKLVDAADAFRDPIFKRRPKIVPAGESLVWALAKETGRFEGRLRYPGEDGDYEKPKMDALGL